MYIWIQYIPRLLVAIFALLLTLFVTSCTIIIIISSSLYYATQIYLDVFSVQTCLTPCWSVLEFWKIKLEKSSSTNWIFNLQKSISKLIFAGYTGSKNPVQNRLKIQFVDLDFSKLIFQKSSRDQSCLISFKYRTRAIITRYWILNVHKIRVLRKIPFK